uniref:Pyrin domain-containing protein n=1 Tax=Seriola lalandi dorsalis TaxID=1841481 RepID=A0A3B4X680_SERLL
MSKTYEKLLETLEDLSYGEINEFKFVLQSPETTSGHPIIPKRQMKMAQRVDLVELMMQTYGERSVEVTNEVLKKINRSDLVQRLSEISSGSKGKLFGRKKNLQYNSNIKYLICREWSPLFNFPSKYM